MKDLIQPVQIYNFLLEQTRKIYRLNSKRVQKGKISQVEIEERNVKLVPILLEGLEYFYNDATTEKNKRKNLEKSYYYQILRVASLNWGNDKYKEKIFETFTLLTLEERIKRESLQKTEEI
jgi:hypothetical protein